MLNEAALENCAYINNDKDFNKAIHWSLKIPKGFGKT